MSTEVTTFDYAALPADQAVRVRAAAERIHVRTKVAIIENGRDLLAVRGMPEMAGRFVAWLEAEFNLSEGTAYNMMQVAENLGERFVNFTNVGLSVLYALAAPSTPDHVRDDVAARAAAGEKITVAEVERLKREAKIAQEAVRRLEVGHADLLTRVDVAIAREREARDHLRLVREQAAAERQRAAADARAAVLADAEQARRDAEAAMTSARKAQADLEAAVKQAREDAEEAARARAEALAEEAIARRRGELAEIEGRAKAAEDKARRHYEAEQRLAAEIRQHQEFLARTQSAEREATSQIEAADALMAALSDAMISLHGFEHAPLPQAARKLAMAQQMCTQMADAIAAFLAPRVPETRSDHTTRPDALLGVRADAASHPKGGAPP